MRYLIKNCKLIQKGNPQDGKVVDILIDKGSILKIDKNISDAKAKSIEGEDLHVSEGWMDIGTHLGEPGYEHRETFETLALAAKKGGFTDLVTMPKSLSAIQTKTQISALIQEGKTHGINIRPMGALSQDLDGENITEFIDMHHAGAVAFTDGLKPIDQGGLLMRALQYTKRFKGLIMHHPNDESLSNGDLIHEGEISVQLGMKGCPTIAEEMHVFRDLRLANYTDSKLNIHLISSKDSLAIIKNAKKSSNKITLGLSYLNLLKSYEDLVSFDSNLKVKPILRSKKDLKALRKAVISDTADYICTNHVPLEIEQKHLEYPYAAHGAIGLETCFAALATLNDDNLTIDKIIEKLTTGPRKVLNIESNIIEEGKPAILTVFDLNTEWTYEEKEIASLSKNSPFIGAQFKGKVVATFNEESIYSSVSKNRAYKL